MLPKVTIHYFDSVQECCLSLAVTKYAYEAHPGVYGYFNEDILDEILLQMGEQTFEDALIENKSDIAACNSLEQQRKEIIKEFREGQMEVVEGYNPMTYEDYRDATSFLFRSSYNKY